MTSSGGRGPGDLSGRVRIADLDGGVCRRLTTRARITSGAGMIIGTVLIVVAAIRCWDLASAALALLGLGAVMIAAVAGQRARIWSASGSSPLSAASGRTATAGPPRPLFGSNPGDPLRRRLGAVVVPIHGSGGESPGGGALIVHARSDQMSLADGDPVQVCRLGRTGTLAGGVDLAGPGRVVLQRVSDGVVFLGSTHLTDTW